MKTEHCSYYNLCFVEGKYMHLVCVLQVLKSYCSVMSSPSVLRATSLMGLSSDRHDPCEWAACRLVWLCMQKKRIMQAMSI